MIISRKNIRFDKMLSCCSGENSPWETNKREDNTRPRSSRRGFFPLLVQRKLLFFFGDTFDALARECAVRVYANPSSPSWKPDNGNRGNIRRVEEEQWRRASLPPPPFSTTSTGETKVFFRLPASLILIPRLSSRFYVEMLRREGKRERNIPSSLCPSIAVERFRK